MNRFPEQITSVADAQYFARRRLPRSVMQQLENGAGAFQTHESNLRALQEVMFRPHHGVRVENRDQSVTVLGHQLRTPLIASSIGGLRIAHSDGELGVTRAIGDAGGIQFVSGVTTTSIEEIVKAARGPVYFQLYYSRAGRAGMTVAIERAKRAGADGLVFCIDSALGHTPPRVFPIRQRYFLPKSASLSETVRFLPQLVTRPAWTLDFLRGGMSLQAPMATDEDGRELPFGAAAEAAFERWVDWSDLDWIREVWDCPIIVKGVLSAEEARQAAGRGAAAVVVSNHGGNRLDGTVPSLPALPEVVAAVGDEIDVLFDSGIRTGPDVVKALALGAKAVGLGRAYLYPLAAAGEAGVRRILELLRRDIDRTMAYLGCSSLDQLSPDHLQVPNAGWDGGRGPADVA
jgi:isopentenyl diphosphate isomerase/L-lactate dehydrogenase-like FMN-dependent dehydrogenase